MSETKELVDFKKISLTVDLSEHSKDKYQLVYASQLYGTFFAVGAKFNVLNDQLKSMELAIINYKGNYNLGLLPQTKDTWNCDNKIDANLCLHLKANGGLHGHKPNQSIVVECNTDISSLKKMIVGRSLSPIYEDVPTNYEEHLHQPLFDSEFYERDGIAIRKRERLDNSLGPQTIGKCQNSFVYFVH
ncbi:MULTISPECIES: hypothetical protein [Maribacter]|uniref:hypothetical protein n=1 Tax=Maribacter TaxID=252356 RepID=UPI001B2D4D2E|nr:hypothetical protein [Maribacter dokdonensis]CAG2534724.1 hypothetical protein MAR621_00547 [Maribacter dokdonensis]